MLAFPCSVGYKLLGVAVTLRTDEEMRERGKKKKEKNFSRSVSMTSSPFKKKKKKHTVTFTLVAPWQRHVSTEDGQTLQNELGEFPPNAMTADGDGTLLSCRFFPLPLACHHTCRRAWAAADVCFCAVASSFPTGREGLSNHQSADGLQPG